MKQIQLVRFLVYQAALSIVACSHSYDEVVDWTMEDVVVDHGSEEDTADACYLSKQVLVAASHEQHHSGLSQLNRKHHELHSSNSNLTPSLLGEIATY